jgi:hypothetical protein
MGNAFSSSKLVSDGSKNVLAGSYISLSSTHHSLFSIFYCAHPHIRLVVYTPPEVASECSPPLLTKESRFSGTGLFGPVYVCGYRMQLTIYSYRGVH